jgi:hypothetical protein
MHCNGTEGSLTFTNDTAYGDSSPPTGKAGHTYITAAQSKFGGSSVFFSGDFANGQVLGWYWLPDPAETDYTVDLWIRPAAKAGYIFDKYGGCYFDAGVLKYRFYADGGDRALPFENPGAGKTIALNTWNHIAVTRSGLTVRTFLNGEVIGVYNGTTKYVLLSSVGYFNIGGTAFNQNLYSGYIDEFRVVLNKAMWTGNFTPPTQPYINPTN